VSIQALGSIFRQALAVIAAASAKITPVGDDLAEAVSMLRPDLAPEAQALRMLMDEANKLLQAEASGTESALLTDVAQIVAQAEPLIRN